MAKIEIAGSSTGTATYTIQSPSGSTNRVLTLPDNTGTIITQNSTPAFASTIGVGGATAAASGAGITFPATQSASSDANTLDDYEEGTWTPTSPSAGYTISSSSGAYTKIGRVVHIRITVNFSAVNAGSNSGVIVGGLPFTVGESNFGVVRDNTSTGSVYMLFARGGETTVEINSMDGVGSGNTRTIRVNEVYSGTVIYTV